MKNILIASLILMILGCSSKAGNLTSEMEPFMKTNFPDATFEIVIKDNFHQINIDDKGNLFNQDSGEELMVKTFGEFYRVFRKSSNSAATDSKFHVLYENETLNWRSDTLDLFQLGEIYSISVN